MEKEKFFVVRKLVVPKGMGVRLLVVIMADFLVYKTFGFSPIANAIELLVDTFDVLVRGK